MPDTTTPLAERLTAHAVLVRDPAVPGVAADYWEASEPHYRTVDGLLSGFVTGDAAAAYRALCADPTSPSAQRELTRRLRAADCSPLAAAVAEADRHIWIDYHLGADHDPAAPAVSLVPRTTARPGPAAADIVIPFRDREGGGLRTRNLLACLTALADQEPDGPAHRVTVVETDDRPRSRELLEPLVDAYVFAEKPGLFNKSWAVNVGSRQVDSPWLCILDADILVDRSFVRRNVERLAGGTHGTHLPFRWSLSLDEPSSLYALRARTVLGAAEVSASALRGLLLREPPGGCVWVRNDVFRQVGGFDERFEGWDGEDDDVVARLGAAAPVVRYEDTLLHLDHPRPAMTRDDGVPFNAHIEPLSWAPPEGGYGDPYAYRQ
ncbi:glycosyltransferase [Streptomyces sp. ET3-23]|uniref:glycosyltransferase family 2 protein n=1 Tax=Streptomyces sp. ET3-23 TaxID=2885643 RepID=UPI001D0FA71B|nr:glycosyltransferase [Streptomyces sp. ET3-23]MCC2279122.1 glycosyltransferase [Streptomyces sp. ET3-23]